MTYALKFRPSVLKRLKKIPPKELRRIKRRLGTLTENLPNPAITKMKGNNTFHKVRVGDYRIIYEIHEHALIILIVKIGHRKDVYEHLDR